MKVKRIFVFTDGDPSVGIGGQSATITADGDCIVDTDDFDEANWEAIKNSLAEAFSDLWDEKAHVLFVSNLADEEE